MSKVFLEGSERDALDVHETRAADQDASICVVVELRRKTSEAVDADRILSPEEFAAQLGADPNHIDLLASIAADYGLKVESASIRSRQVVLRGRLGDFVAMFGANVREACIRKKCADKECADKECRGEECEDEECPREEWFRYRTGSLEIPAELKDVVLSVSGLDTRPQVEPRLARRSPIDAPQFLLPVDIAHFHGFLLPKGNGKGAIIAILLFGGGFEVKDVMTSRALQGITEPLNIESFNVGDYRQTVGTSDHHREAALDIQVCSAVAPEAELRLYFASRATSSVIRALAEAVHAEEPPTVITMSWGAPEGEWSEQLRSAFDRLLEDAEHLGISFFAASGDNGPGKKATDPDFPASSPRTTACGGIEVISDPDRGLVPVAWNAFDRGMATGGGFSKCFPRPSFQDLPGLSHEFRGIPDVSGYAGLNPGYLIVFGGQAICLGATSAVAPLYAAFVARVARKKLLPKMNHLLYSLGPDQFQDVTQGDTGLGRGVSGFVASEGWDVSTGLGCLIGKSASQKLRELRVPRPGQSPLGGEAEPEAASPGGASPGGEDAPESPELSGPTEPSVSDEPVELPDSSEEWE